MKHAPIVFFDGVCGLCNTFVDFIIPRDKRAIYRFAPLQGETATEYLKGRQGSEKEGFTSVVLVDEKGTHWKSDAALRILVGLGGAWFLIRLLYVFPRVLRDAAYDFVARNRYKWFDKLESCRLPTAKERERFLP